MAPHTTRRITTQLCSMLANIKIRKIYQFMIDGGQVPELGRRVAPWVVFAPVGDGSVARRLEDFEKFGGVVRFLDARDMQTPADLFAAFASGLGFPGYFGRNWDALVDCLYDLHGDWHARLDVAIVIRNGDQLVEREFLALFVSVLCLAAAQANSGVDLDGFPTLIPAISEHFIIEYETALPETIATRVQYRDVLVEQMGKYVFVTDFDY